jgi:hypothetical protein
MGHAIVKRSWIILRKPGIQREEGHRDQFREVYKVISTDMTMETQVQKRKAAARSPTLQTVLMVERFINDNSGEYRKTELWRKLPRRVMWQTFQVIMTYLEDTNRIVYDQEGCVVYAWNPKLVAQYKSRSDLRWIPK